MFDDLTGLGLTSWLQTVRESAPSSVDGIMLAVSSGAFYQYIPIIICAFLLWFADRRGGELAGLSIVIASTLAQFLKDAIDQPRPWELDESIQPSDEALEHAGGSSMPSGHAAVSVAAYGSLAMWFGRSRKAVVCVAAFVMVAFSRLYLGVHTPADVLVGALIAVCVVLINRKVLGWSYISDSNYRKVSYVYIAAVLLVSAGIMIVSDTGRGDAALSASMAAGFLVGRHIEHFRVGYSVPDIADGRKVVYTVAGLIPIVIMLLVPPMLLGEVAGYLVGGFAGAVWMTLMYPMILKRTFGTGSGM